jgi:hypothetical protein
MHPANSLLTTISNGVSVNIHNATPVQSNAMNFGRIKTGVEAHH